MINRELTRRFLSPDVRDALMNVTMNNGQKIPLRNDHSLSFTFDRLSTALTNLAASGVHVPATKLFSHKKENAASTVRRFSSEVYNYRGVTNSYQNGMMATDIIDITLSSTIHSLWQWFCVERNVDTQTTNFTYSQLIANNSVSGFSPGDPVISPITAPPLNLYAGDSVDISVNKTLANNDYIVNLGGPVMPGSIKGYLTADIGEGKEVIVDTSNGYLFGKGRVANVNYKTGVITFANGSEQTYNAALTFKAIADRVHDKTGDRVLKMGKEMITKPVAAVTCQLILQGNAFDNINYNKMVHRITQSSEGQISAFTDPYEMSLQQLTIADIANKNNMAIEKLVEATRHAPQLVLDWSTMSLTGYSGTYQMFVKMQMLKVRGDMALRTGKEVTCWMVDMKASYAIGAMEGFVANGYDIGNGRDGLIGTLDGIPVVRAAGLDGKSRVADAVAINNSNWNDKDKPELYGLIIGVHKDPSGLIAPCAFGEYLPPYTTILAGNYDQPLMMSSTLFSSIAVDTLAPELVCSIALKPFPTSTLEVAKADAK